MGIILGYLCLLCICLLMAKAITRKFKLGKADYALKKIHKLVCTVFIVLCLFHIVFVVPVFWTRNIVVYIAGVLAVLLFILIVFSYHRMSADQKKRMRCHRILAAILLLCIVEHMVMYWIDFQKYQTKISSIQLSEIDISAIEDGQYIGSYDAGYIYAIVQVMVMNGRIQDIILLDHRNERGKAAEQVIPDLIDAGTFPVDAVSGATNSSKVIQKAVENALNEGNTKQK